MFRAASATPAGLGVPVIKIDTGTDRRGSRRRGLTIGWDQGNRHAQRRQGQHRFSTRSGNDGN
jgi:hypothetical protein